MKIPPSSLYPKNAPACLTDQRNITTFLGPKDEKDNISSN